MASEMDGVSSQHTPALKEEISPSAIAIKALQLWQISSSDPVVEEQLQILLKEKGVPKTEIPSLIKAASPIFESLRTAMSKRTNTDIPASITSMATHHQRPRFPDPEPFDGTRALYPIFKQKAKAKINIDGSIYGTENGQVSYLFNRLSGTAAKIVLPWLNSQANPTVDNFWTFMDSRFSDPQAKAKALDKLQSMKQKPNEDVRDYLARFEGELLESEVNMDDAVKISTFTRGLKIQVQKDIAMVNNATNFQEYCNEVIRIQDAHRRIGYLSKQPLATGYVSASTSAARPDPMTMDWEPTHANVAQLSAGRTIRRAKWVTPEEIQRRRSNRLCIRCGASGHMISACQYAPARRPSGHAVVASALLEEPQLEEEGEIISGKE